MTDESADASVSAPPVKQPASKKPPAGKKTPTTKTAAVRTAAARGGARSASTKSATEDTAAKASAVKSAASKSSAAKAAATKSSAAKTAAAKAAASRSAANKSAAQSTAAKSAAAKTAAAKAAATKAAAAKAAADEATETPETPVRKTTTRKPAANKPAPKSKPKAEPKPKAAPKPKAKPKPIVSAEDAAPASEAVRSPAPEPLVALFEPEVASAESGVDAPMLEAEVLVDNVPEADAPATAGPIEAVAQAAGDVVTEPADDPSLPDAIVIRGLVKNFGDHRAVNEIDLTVRAGSFYGIVGPNGAGKTTTLSILAGLLRANAGKVVICGIDQATDPLAAKRVMGVLPDRLRTFDRLTGRQLLHYYGLLRGLAADVIEKRTADLARAFDLVDALSRVVSDYSAGMTKKIMLAGAMIHSPRVLVLDEPFEAVDPVSSAVILDILRAYVAHGGTVILSSHGMDLVERVCSRVAIIVDGVVLAEGTIDEVRAGQTLEARFVELSGGLGEVEGLEWLHTFSD